MNIESPQLMKYATSLYTHFAGLPSPAYARLRSNRKCMNADGLVSLSTKWTQVDPSRKDRISFAQEYLISLEKAQQQPKLVYVTPGSIASTGACFPYAGDAGAKQLCDIEQGNQRLFFIEYKIPSGALGDPEVLKASAATPGTFVHVHCRNTGRKLKTIKLPTEKIGKAPPVHGRVYGSGCPSTPFSACRFCSTDETKVVFLAEAAPSQSTKENKEDVGSLYSSYFFKRYTA